MERLGLSYSAILPEILLGLTGIVLMLVEAFAPGRGKVRAGIMALVGLGAAFVATLSLWGAPPQTAFAGMILVDGFRVLFTLIVIVAVILSIFLSWNFLDEERIAPTEYFALILFCAVGMTLLTASQDLAMVFLGIETVTISTYVLAGFRRDDVRSTEAAIKYFILGAFSSAFLLYGIALVYGAARTTNLAGIQQVLSGPMTEPAQALMLAGAAMLLIGFGFKVTTVPFHIWTPDVYEGAPTPVTAFLSAGPKAAGFAAFLRVFSLTFGTEFNAESAGRALQSDWISALAVMAILTMTFGNLIAITQTNIKRLLAYSSIAHAGYVLLGIVAQDWRAVAFYLLAYTIMNLGAFAVVALIARRQDEKVLIEDYSGLGFRQPGLSFPLTIFLISLTGIPGTAGFVGKFWLFKSAWEAGFKVLVLVAVINTVVAAYYYLYVVIVMFFREPKERVEPVPLPPVFALTLAVTVFGTFYLGLLPSHVFQFLSNAQTSGIARSSSVVGLLSKQLSPPLRAYPPTHYGDPEGTENPSGTDLRDLRAPGTPLVIPATLDKKHSYSVVKDRYLQKRVSGQVPWLHGSDPLPGYYGPVQLPSRASSRLPLPFRRGSYWSRSGGSPRFPDRSVPARCPLSLRSVQQVPRVRFFSADSRLHLIRLTGHSHCV